MLMARTYTPLCCHIFSCLLFSALAEQLHECNELTEGSPCWLAAEAAEGEGLELLQKASQQKVSTHRARTEVSTGMSLGVSFTRRMKSVLERKADWKCHAYNKKLGEDDHWCKDFPKRDGYQFAFTSGVFDLCGNCWCCSSEEKYSDQSFEETGQLMEQYSEEPQGNSWQCHLYSAGQSDDWCASAGVQGGYEYAFNAGETNSCGNCWCCKRAVAESYALSPEDDEESAGSMDSSNLIEDRDGIEGWQCHEYADGEDDTWCKMMGTWASVKTGYEYEFTGGNADLCGDCWCCKRAVSH